MNERLGDRIGGLAAVFAHPDDESFGCAGALALAHDAGRLTRLLLVDTRRGRQRRRHTGRRARGRSRGRDALRGGKIGLDEVTVLEGYADGGVAEAPFDQLVDEIALWLADRRPDAVITFGPHGITGHPDHVVAGIATRWAVERLAERGIAPHAVYVVSPVFGPAASASTSPRRSRPPPTGWTSPLSPGGGSRPSSATPASRRRRGAGRAARRARVARRRLRGLHAGPAARSRRPIPSSTRAWSRLWA